MARRSFHTVPVSSIALGALALVAACSSGSDSPSFTLRSTNQSVAANTQVVFSGRNMAYLADEATTGAGGTDFNADGDKVDAIAVVVNTGNQSEDVLNVAAQRLAWVDDELYLIVDESEDEVDWNTDTDTDDIVLLHWSSTSPLAFIDGVTSSGLQMVARDSRLFFTSSFALGGANDSNVNIIESSSPLVATTLTSTDATGGMTPTILAFDEGLIFLGIDEVEEGRDMNGDGDATDENVLALLDGTRSNGVIRSTELALADDSGPFRAKSAGSSDWQVGFVVSEADQDSTNFNNHTVPEAGLSASWQPSQCIGDEDTDTTDAILFFLEFADWNANPVTDPPRNTGLVAKDKIAIANNFIATISEEAEEGTCDLNGDGDTSDDVVRWTQIVGAPDPILPLNTAANIHALFDVPGGTHGLAELDNRYVIVVSESDDDNDLNGGGQTMNLIGWLSPTNSANAWDFQHGNPQSFVGTTWMAEQLDRAVLDVALEERVNSVNINSHTPPVAGEDPDTNDSVPTFADFTGGSTLSFPGVAIAADSDNAGIVVARGFGFYRVSEGEDSRNWNADADEADFVLWRTSLSQGTSTYMGVLNSLSRRAIEVNLDESPSSGAFLAQESQQGAGTDFNTDGDTNDFVLRYFSF